MADGEELGLIDGTGTEEAEIETDGLDTGTDDGAGATDDASRGAEREKGDEGDRGDEPADKGRVRDPEPIAIRKALRETLSANAELAKKYPRLEKQITGALFAKQTLDKLGGVARFTELSEAIEAHGGIDGVAQLAETVENYNALEQGFDKGDPAVVVGWAKDYPNGLLKAIPTALEEAEKISGEKYDQIVSAEMIKTFNRVGAFTVFEALDRALAAGKVEDIKTEWSKFRNFVTNLQGLAGRAKTDPYADRARELDEREQSIAEQDHTRFMGSVRQEVNTAVTQHMNSLLRQAIKVRRVESSMANRVRAEVTAELKRQVAEIPAYARNYKAVMAARDKDRAASFIVNAARGKLQKVIARVLSYPEYKFLTQGGNGADSRTVRRPAGASGTVRREGGETVVNGRPKTGDVDFTKTDKARFLASIGGHGEAWLRNGKRAKW